MGTGRVEPAALHTGHARPGGRGLEGGRGLGGGMEDGWMDDELVVS